MQPLSEDERAAVLADHPEAAPGEIENDLEEYEGLLADLFTEDPDLPPAAPGPFAIDAPAVAGSSRLRELHSKLFGDSGE